MYQLLHSFLMMAIINNTKVVAFKLQKFDRISIPENQVDTLQTFSALFVSTIPNPQSHPYHCKKHRCSLTSLLPTYPVDPTDHPLLTLPRLIFVFQHSTQKAMPAGKPSRLWTDLLLPLSLLPLTQSLSCLSSIATDDSCSQLLFQAAYMYCGFYRQHSSRRNPGNLSLHYSLQHQADLSPCLQTHSLIHFLYTANVL